MFNYIQLPQTIRYDNPIWPGFYVLIVPNRDATQYRLYLTHESFGVIHEMYGVCKQPDGTMATIDQIVECAHYAMEDFLPDFVKDCCTDEE